MALIVNVSVSALPIAGKLEAGAREPRPAILVPELAARLLEKAIVGEWHEVSVLIERSERLGKRWKAAEGGGK